MAPIASFSNTRGWINSGPMSLEPKQGKQDFELDIVRLFDDDVALAAQRLLDGKLIVEGEGNSLTTSVAGGVVDGCQAHLAGIVVLGKGDGALIGIQGAGYALGCIVKDGGQVQRAGHLPAGLEQEEQALDLIHRRLADCLKLPAAKAQSDDDVLVQGDDQQGIGDQV